jgi:hypothetical protein
MCLLMSNYRGSRSDKKLDAFNDGVVLAQTQTVEQSEKKKKKKKKKKTRSTDSTPADVEEEDDDENEEDLLRQAVQAAWFNP